MKRSSSQAWLSEGGSLNSKAQKGNNDASPAPSPSPDVSPTVSEGQPGLQDQPKSSAKVSQSSRKPAAKGASLLSDDDLDVKPRVPGSANDKGGGKEEDEEEEENLDGLEFGKYLTVDPDKMQAVLNKFTTEQMSRYECYRRSGFQRANMRRLLANVAGCTISIPMTIVMSGIAKMFVGELVEVGRIVMTERKESGPIRPCHVREAYRRLKLEGKVPLRGRARLFR